MRALLLVVMMVLAGCAGSSSPPLPPVSSSDVWATGEAAGQAWRDDAVLLSVAAVEMDHVSEVPDNATAIERLLRRTTDPELGDGLARVWLFRHYSHSAEQHRTFAVGASGVLAEHVDDAEARPDVQPLNEQAVTSQEVVAVLREQTEWEEQVARLGSNATVVMEIGAWGTDRVWLAAAVDDQGSSLHLVDAATGELMPFFSLVFQEAGRRTGWTTAVNAPTTFTVDLEARHETMAWRFTPNTMEPTLPMHTFTATVRSPTGDETVHTWTTGTGMQPDPGLVLTDLKPGTYDVTVALTTGAASGWQLSWCTDGIPWSFTANAACELV